MEQVRFHDLRFDGDFLTAVDAAGTTIRFTRQERALLGLLAAHPRRLYPRAELIEALGSNGSDRNVDFVINRLRRKLGDTHLDRRFIGTQYGEGYVWIAAPVAVSPDAGLLVIGPVRGDLGPAGQAVLASLASGLQAELSPARPVPVLAAATPDALAALGGRFSLDVIFHDAGDRLEAGFVLREQPTGATVAPFRRTFSGLSCADIVAELATAIGDAAWTRLALGPSAAPSPTDQPLHLRLQTASMMLDPPGVTWLANREHIARMRDRDPADPVAALMWAMHLFAKTVLDVGETPYTAAHLAPIELEIERLVLGALPAVRQDPLMALAAAKLLVVVHRGHEAEAQALAERAFADSAAFAAAFPLLGQLAAHRGDVAEAVRLFDEGLRLCEAGSEFEVYIQFLKASTLLAADDRDGVAVVFERMVAIKPSAMPQVGLFFLPPGDAGLARRLQPLVDRAELSQARKVVAYQYHRTARYFSGPGHAANVMHGPLSHFVRRFGADVASAELWAAIPRDLHHLRAMARA